MEQHRTSRDKPTHLRSPNLWQWRRQWHPTPVLLPGKSHGQRSLEDCSPWGHWESDTTSLSLFTFMHWRGKWQPTPVFLPGESQGRESLVGCRLWRRTESDTSEALCWRRVRGLWKHPDGRDWLRGKLGLDLMGGVMLSKSLIQFSVEWSCVPSLLFTWSQTMVTSLVAQMVRHLPTMQET